MTMETTIKSKDTIGLVNPWSKMIAPDNYWTWAQIVEWCNAHIHESNRADWLREARRAARNDDGETLGAMIIAS